MSRVVSTINNIEKEIRLAIWGASFQLERLLAYTELDKKILFT